MSEPIRDHCEDAYPELKMSCEDWVKRGAKHCPFCGTDQCDGHTIKFTHINDEGYVHEHEIAAKYEVCSRCHGEGVHDPPGFSDGFTANDFAEEYFQGRYDVQCTTCKGLRVELVVDRKHADPDTLKAYDAHQQTLWEIEQERKSEMRFGY